jgi:hypothetical protein
MNSHKERPNSKFSQSTIDNGGQISNLPDLLIKPKQKVSSNVSSLNVTPKMKNKSFTSISKLNNSELNPQQEQVYSKLKRIFEYYTSYGDKLNFVYLNSHKFQKFAIESKIIDESFTKTRLELIFTIETKPVNKKQLKFEMFLDSLIKIAEYKYVQKNSKETPQSALNKLLKLHILPLHDKLFGKEEIEVSEYQRSIII